MMLDSLRAEEEGRSDLLVGHALRRVQGYPCFLGRERLGAHQILRKLLVWAGGCFGSVPDLRERVWIREHIRQCAMC